MTTKQEAGAQISKNTDEAQRLIREAQSIADEHGLEFYFCVSYGMGGSYTGHQKPDNWDSSDDYYDEESGWSPSSQSC